MRIEDFKKMKIEVLASIKILRETMPLRQLNIELWLSSHFLRTFIFTKFSADGRHTKKILELNKVINDYKMKLLWTTDKRK